MKKIGFDPQKYIEEQSKYILERVNNYDKLYLEFGGKLIGDMHAKRVLPGFDQDAKIKLLHKLKDKTEIIICVFAGDIERNKIRGDYGITYDMDIMRLIDELSEYELAVNSVVITRYNGQPSTKIFINKLKQRGIKVFTHGEIEGYPVNVDKIVSDEGFGKNEYIPTTKPIVVVTGPGAGSGKLATCLNQLYHESRHGNTGGYSKFETFPVWNVPLKHPLNIAYEAATVDLKDVNMIDSFHFDYYGEVAINYNRDLETFPIIKRTIERITGRESEFHSPTDMGVNRVGFGIIDDEVVQEASKQEIIRRYFETAANYKKGITDIDTLNRIQIIMEEIDLRPEDRPCVKPARDYAEELKTNDGWDQELVPPVMALELADGNIITGRGSDLMDASAAAILNAIKKLANIGDEILLLSPNILEPIQKLKANELSGRITSLNTSEILIALSISAVTNPTAQLAYEKLTELKDTQAHSTVIFNKDDEQVLRNLGISFTCDPIYPSKNLFYV
ncbi:DUF1846 domain-containing protein [Enterococcus saccharolyticus]|uniref:ATP-dependent Zn protease n=1 Tax=Enterococcus saccharolyticus subsp. saccharolyticus ATCC 43076 TaxID=1139996 RepID=S0N539_9ENTE|nr:DUF1846 domain-containing protein [Enterococcus saccharolyticus]EOT26404.1 ATP-dependent Zn protease [Enterococcus saccharolyticus subsp. saccharolyticus ATCC 43076]EOT76364.1 ATP-dependent Zn protease [Enterococcus saccharolyticus subsp. saccharolyticus ATCC 43076]OJG89870.1 ATP-dependent Zn protease [Enterococcus saccharolyticus]